MPKSTTHIDKLGTIDTFRAPWESEAGADADVDKPTLKRLVFNLKKDLANARDTNEDNKQAVADVEKERDDALAAAADANGVEAQKQIDRLTRERDDYKGKFEKLEADKAHADLKAEVIGDLDPKYAKYVTGATQEELEASLEAVKADFGIESGEGDENENEDEPVVRNRPRTRLTNPADKQNGKGGEVEIDFEKVAENAIGMGLVY